MINKLHLIYTIIIAIAIIVCVIVCQKEAVCPDAFTNFSFAATITSIVLAVVSIVYSIQSGLNANNQMSGIREIETRIGNELDKFRTLDETIRESVGEIIKPMKKQIDDLHEDQVGIRESIESLSNSKEVEREKGDRKGTSKFPYHLNSQWGNVLLYICSLSKKYNKPLPRDILNRYSSDFPFYFYGYMVATNTILHSYFVYSDNNNPMSSLITVFDESYFGKDEYIRTMIEPYRSNPNIDAAIKEVDAYFNK